MAQIVETDDLLKQVEKEVTRDLRYSPDERGAGYVAMQWGVAALGALFLSNVVAFNYSILDFGPYYMYSPIDELPHIMVTVLIVAVIGYVY